MERVKEETLDTPDIEKDFYSRGLDQEGILFKEILDRLRRTSI
jgi:hypothetical protein